MNLRKKIEEYLLLRKKTKRLETLERLTEYTRTSTFSIKVFSDLALLKANPEDAHVAQGIADNLIEEFTKNFKLMFQAYINEEIEKAYNDQTTE